MKEEHKPIGFFDSGVGGISVLREAVKLLPKENFVYFGDSRNAPYGVKSVEEVKKLTFSAFDFLISKDVKAIVVACNTATSAAIEELRERYGDMPVIGIEPALKPAVEFQRSGKIIIMATIMTLAEKKFSSLMKRYEEDAEIQPLPCPGLVEFIENGIVEGPLIEDYLRRKFEPYFEGGIAAVVLGCTHYPFIKGSLKNVLKAGTPVLDGSLGTARQLKRELSKYGILNKSNNRRKIDIYNSSDDPELINLSYKLLEFNDDQAE
ncbi:MAG: glutamate racemase [Clostridiaceae bacterium]